MTPITFRSAIVSRRQDGTLVIALLDKLPAPLAGIDTCVALLECTPEAAAALCADVAQPIAAQPKP